VLVSDAGDDHGGSGHHDIDAELWQVEGTLQDDSGDDANSCSEQKVMKEQFV
jgi:hypothetical protein